MDIEKMRKWLEITNSYRKSDFWSSVLKQTSPDDFFREETVYPVYDIYQNEQYYFIVFEIPGISQEDLSLHLISNTHLKISGNIKPIYPSEMELSRERVHGEFERVIELLEATLPHLLNISIHNGLLYISYPRQQVF